MDGALQAMIILLSDKVDPQAWNFHNKELD